MLRGEAKGSIFEIYQYSYRYMARRSPGVGSGSLRFGVIMCLLIPSDKKLVFESELIIIHPRYDKNLYVVRAQINEPVFIELLKQL